MHGWGLMKGHFGVISEYCKTGLLVIFNVTVRRGRSVRFCRPLCSFRWHSSKSFVMYLPVYTCNHPFFFVGMCPCSKSFVHCKVAELRYRLETGSRFLPWVTGGDRGVQCDPPLASTPTPSLTLSYSQVSSPASARQRAAPTCCSSASIDALTHVLLLGLRVAHHHVQTDAERGQIWSPRQKKKKEAPRGWSLKRYDFSKIVSEVSYSYAEFYDALVKDAEKLGGENAPHTPLILPARVAFEGESEQHCEMQFNLALNSDVCT